MIALFAQSFNKVHETPEGYGNSIQMEIFLISSSSSFIKWNMDMVLTVHCLRLILFIEIWKLAQMVWFCKFELQTSTPMALVMVFFFRILLNFIWKLIAQMERIFKSSSTKHDTRYAHFRKLRSYIIDKWNLLRFLFFDGNSSTAYLFRRLVFRW